MCGAIRVVEKVTKCTRVMCKAVLIAVCFSTPSFFHELVCVLLWGDRAGIYSGIVHLSAVSLLPHGFP